MLKENHPLYSALYSQRENEIKKTYIADPQQIVKTVPQALKQVTPKNYGKEKLVSFKKGQQINFGELHEKIRSIGT